jgi:hypothetical protein
MASTDSGLAFMVATTTTGMGDDSSMSVGTASQVT